MSEEQLLTVAIDVPLSRTFDYRPRNGVTVVPGTRVRVPFGRRHVVGIVTGTTATSQVPANKLRAIAEVLDDEALFDAPTLRLIHFASTYYHHPLGEVFAAATPALLRHGKALNPSVEMLATSPAAAAIDLEALAKRAPKQAELLLALMDAGDAGMNSDALGELLPNWRRALPGLMQKDLVTRFEAAPDDFDEETGVAAGKGPDLNGEQQTAVRVLGDQRCFSVGLLDGVTGSGKTEVYLQRMQTVLDRGEQVLILVPEIGLTPQLVRRLSKRLGLQPAVLHSGLTDTERLTHWRAARAGHARLVIGTRSAVFVPLKNPGLIVVDEEHDPSFKQQEGFRYSARDLALATAKQRDIPIILGSATPTLDSLYQCRSRKYQHIVLSQRAGLAREPELRLIDTLRHPADDGISPPLANAIETHLADGGQILIFLNRRGFAPTLICSSCGHVADCNRCDARLTVHKHANQLRCHHCGSQRAMPESCDECGDRVRPLGEGTQRIEETLAARFPHATLRRIDSDSTQQKGAMDNALAAAFDGSANLLVGTQMLSKGHHFPGLTLVGIVNADQGLFGTDFRSSERMAQSVLQVAGRAGRVERRGEVLIQTAFPDHPFWSALLGGGYTAIAATALAEREQAQWPPFSHLALVRAAAHDRRDAMRCLDIARRTAESMAAAIEIYGPVDAPMAVRAGRHRAQLLLQSSDRKALHRVLSGLRAGLEADAEARRARWSIDVDPIELL